MMKKWLITVLAFAFLAIGYSSEAQAAVAGDKDCGDFSSKEQVMEFWYSNGYNAGNDPHDLDRDNDGLPCEVSKGDYDSFIKNQQASENNGNTSPNTTSNQGGTLPNTASNNVSVMLMSTGVVAIGMLLILRRRRVKE